MQKILYFSLYPRPTQSTAHKGLHCLNNLKSTHKIVMITSYQIIVGKFHINECISYIAGILNYYLQYYLVII